MIKRTYDVDEAIAAAFEQWVDRRMLVRRRVVEALLIYVTTLGAEEFTQLAEGLREWQERQTEGEAVEAHAEAAVLAEADSPPAARRRGGRRKAARG